MDIIEGLITKEELERIGKEGSPDHAKLHKIAEHNSCFAVCEEYGIIPPIITQEQAEAMRPAENLKPSPHGEECPHNGEHPGIEIACDECDFFLACFPEYGKGYTKLETLADNYQAPITESLAGVLSGDYDPKEEMELKAAIAAVSKFRAVATMRGADLHEWEIVIFAGYPTLEEAQADVERFKANYAGADSPVSVVSTRIEPVEN